jgi:glycosyltransferase involved in cell wall biosynthesis
VAGARLLVDVTQYASWPAKSGVQRVLLHLAAEWPGDRVAARFGFIDGSSYVTGPIEWLGSVIRLTFATSNGRDSVEEVRDALRARSAETIATDDVEQVFDAYLLPEPTLQRDSLAVAERVRARGRIGAYFIYFDAIPLTHPEFFAKATDTDGSVTRYHQVLSGMDHVAFISAAARELFEGRIARRRLDGGRVATLGADGLPKVTISRPKRPVFTILGTVEPRKRHQVVLDAFENLWDSGRDYMLVVLGPPGSGQPDLLKRLRELSETSRLNWLPNPRDDAVADHIARSSAVLFTSAVEGSGLPALEALALGCPVIVSDGVPALEGIGSAGQIRLETVDAESVATAVEALADPATNDALRAAIEGLHLPTWASFAADVEAWIADSLRVP